MMNKIVKQKALLSDPIPNSNPKPNPNLNPPTLVR